MRRDAFETLQGKTSRLWRRLSGCTDRSDPALRQNTPFVPGGFSAPATAQHIASGTHAEMR